MPSQQLYLDRNIEIESRLADFLQSLTALQSNLQADREISHEVLSKLPLLLTEEDEVKFNLQNNELILPSVPSMLRQMNVTRLDALTSTADVLVDGQVVLDTQVANLEGRTSTLEGQTTSLTERTTVLESTTVPVGSVLIYAGSQEPNGWVFCDGRSLSRTTYLKLFQIIGTLYGTGDGTSTFNLPDTRGIFVKGAGTTGRTNGKTANNIFYSGTLGMYQPDMMQGHHHTAVSYGSLLASGTTNNWWGVANSPASSSSGLVGASDARADNSNGTPRTGNQTMPANLSLNYIIFTGVL